VGEYTSIALGSDGNLHISYFDRTNTNLRYCTGAFGNWACETVYTNGGYWSSIALDPSGNVHITAARSGSTTFYCTNSLGSWVCQDIESVSSFTPTTAIAVDSSGTAHISHGSSSSDLRYCTGTYGSFSCESVDSNGSDGNLHIASRQYSGGTTFIRYCSGTSGNWTCGVVEKGPPNGVSKRLAIAFGSDGNAHIAYGNYPNGVSRYCTGTMGNWTCQDIVGPHGSKKGSSFSITEANGIGHMSYFGSDYDLHYCTAVVPEFPDFLQAALALGTVFCFGFFYKRKGKS
jgi:hypothetical protein